MVRKKQENQESESEQRLQADTTEGDAGGDEEKHASSPRTRTKKQAADTSLPSPDDTASPEKKPRRKRRRRSDEDELRIPGIMPVLPLKDVVVYPFAMQPLGVGQARSIRLIEDIMRTNRLVVMVAQKSADIDSAGPDDIFKIGTVSRIARMIRMPDGTLQIIVQGLERVEIGEFVQEKPYLTAHISAKPEVQESDDETEAIKRNVVGYFQRLVTLVQNVREEIAATALNMEEARQVAYLVATFVQMDLELRQKVLELDSVRAKLEQLSAYLAHELDIFELGRKIQTSAQEEMSKVQREYLLREQLKAIQRELGEESEEQATINELRRKIDEARMPEEALKEATANCRAWKSCPPPRPNTASSAPISNCWQACRGARAPVSRSMCRTRARYSSRITMTWRKSRTASWNTWRCGA